jgi:hypothetical protein
LGNQAQIDKGGIELLEMGGGVVVEDGTINRTREQKTTKE